MVFHEESVGDYCQEKSEGSKTCAASPSRQGKLLHLRLTHAKPCLQFKPFGGEEFNSSPRSFETKRKGPIVHKLLKVETNSNIFQIQFGQVQFEITGRCNLQCKHCRAAGDKFVDVSLDQIRKVMKFARMFSPPHAEVIASGGEPLIHHKFPKVMEIIRSNGGDSVTLTTNGLLVNREVLAMLDNLGFERLMLSVSLDSLNAREHDDFRGRVGAFKRANEAIRLIVGSNMKNTVASVRMTLRPGQLSEMETMTRYVYDMGCQRVSFSSIHPSGRAIDHPELWMNTAQLKQFVGTIYHLRTLFPRSFQIGTNDPLKCLFRTKHDVGTGNEVVFDGCAAGAVTFNVNASGVMTPCALLNIPIMQTNDLTVEEMVVAYQKSEVVKNLLEMNLKGKCGSCNLKYQCGGCRARALTRNGDYLGEDPCCWK